MIPRGKFSHCGRLHRGLPDFMIPRKHYAAETITKVLEDEISPESFEGTYPVDITMIRWHLWLLLNKALIDGILKSLAHRELGFSEKLLKSADSLLEEMKASYELWLEKIVTVVYNSGVQLSPL